MPRVHCLLFGAISLMNASTGTSVAVKSRILMTSSGRAEGHLCDGSCYSKFWLSEYLTRTSGCCTDRSRSATVDSDRDRYGPVGQQSGREAPGCFRPWRSHTFHPSSRTNAPQSLGKVVLPPCARELRESRTMVAEIG